jgi:2-amino-4-hydroxy-6-hydroxymethyldihydropteridine diphosphokinase
MQTEEVFIGLGSNLGDSATIIEQALSALDNVNQCSLHARSSLYRSAALGDSPQDDYINAVARVDTSLEPMALLLELQAIEQAYYRQRDPQRRWASRTLDLDIILFGNRNMADSHLTIPQTGRRIRNRVAAGETRRKSFSGKLLSKSKTVRPVDATAFSVTACTTGSGLSSDRYVSRFIYRRFYGRQGSPVCPDDTG